MSFDPYYQWLGIPPADQPPHHYRLLGLQTFEPNETAIEHAADRLMTHLRSLQAGDRADTVQQLLNEVAAARVTLLNPETKKDYDYQLRTGRPRPHERAIPRPVDPPVQPAPTPSPKESAPKGPAEHDRGEWARRIVAICAITVMLTMIILLVLWFVFEGPR